MRPYFASLPAVLALSVAQPAVAATDTELAAIHRTIEEMRTEYETRIRDLETRLARAEAQAGEARAEARAARQSAELTAEEGASGARVGTDRTAASAFNPAASVVLQGNAVSYSRDPEQWRLPGFQLGGEAGLRSEGLSLDETEVILSANVDDWFYGQTTLALHDHEGETEVELEEAFFDTLSLPAGLALRGGRFFSDIGYLNSQHSHAWDFADAPLPYQAFLGGQYRDDGVRLSWVAPTDLFLELGVEALRGDNFPGGGSGDDLLGSTQTLSARLGGDLGASHSWRLGLSALTADPQARGEGLAFAGDSDLGIVDLVWKWAPEGDASRRNLSLQGELFQRSEDGVLSPGADEAGGPFGPSIRYDGDQGGLYGQAVYQFMPRWRLGLRYDRLWTDNELEVRTPAAAYAAVSALRQDSTPANLAAQWMGLRGLRADLLESSGLADGDDPTRWSAMLDYSHSEFSRIRLQYALDDSTGETDHQWILQYILTLGAHGAHSF